MSRVIGLNTQCVHSARAPEATTGAVAQPIYLSTTFERNADGGYPRGYRYSREGNPNRKELKEPDHIELVSMTIKPGEEIIVGRRLRDILGAAQKKAAA